MKPHHVVFFSFKGGVGRTSALMNVALQLSRRKKRVLIVDLDYTAPGVDIFEMPPEHSVMYSFSGSDEVASYWIGLTLLGSEPKDCAGWSSAAAADSGTLGLGATMKGGILSASCDSAAALLCVRVSN